MDKVLSFDLPDAARRSSAPLDIARAMASLRRIGLVSALALAVTSAIAVDLGGYSVVQLHRGLNGGPAHWSERQCAPAALVRRHRAAAQLHR